MTNLFTSNFGDAYWLIFACAFIFSLIVALSAYFCRHKAGANLVPDAEAQFQNLAEAIPQIVWTANSSGLTTYINKRWYEMTGLPEGASLGTAWVECIHPDDRPACDEKWKKCLRTGEVFEIEYRLRDAKGQFRWYLDRATPMRDASGAIVKWFGSCTDIDDQMHTQQLLEEQVRQHTAALMEANDRLQAEMRERARAQQELDEQNQRMVGELTDRSHRATTLAKMAELLQSCADMEDVLSVVVGMGPKLFPELRGALLLLDGSRQMLELADRWSECPLAVEVFCPQDCWAMRTGHMHVVPASDRTAPCKHVKDRRISYFCAPLLSQGEAVGILHFQMRGPGELSDSDLSIATAFADQIGLSVANIRLREALRNQSIRDPLTGLYNRRYLEETLERETRRAVRAELGLGILMFDIDHFKKFNDAYGHDAGDSVLLETAAFLSKSVRAEDIVCRYGGEEFVIILPMANLATSASRAERILAKIRELSVLHQGRVLGKITVSIGVSALPQHGTSPKPLLEAADAALYCAKHEGRNRVAVADTPAKLEEPKVAEKTSAPPVAER